ncbi:unnamed protein product [Urochloa humidicola]
MAQRYHLSLALLLLAGLLATAAATAVAADLPGGKKVTITMTYAAADAPAAGKKIGISVRYVDGDGGSDNQFHLDCDEDEPLGLAVQYLLMTLEKQRDHEASSRSEL